MKKLILIKYGELTLKKGNRNQFINKLKTNIQKVLKNDLIITNYSRMYIEPKNFEETIKKLAKVYGIHSYVDCHEIDSELENIKSTILSSIDFDKYNTFKIETKRSNKNFEIKSMDLNKMLGGLVLENKKLKVDVHNPELVIKIEIREKKTYIYTKEYTGLKGHPVGVAGKGMLMLSGGIDSPVAGYLSLKRGVDLECVYFDSPPHTSIGAKNKVIELANIINEYSGNIKLHVIRFTELQEEIYKNINETYGITIMRRMMYRITELLANKYKCKIIINGESIGQVASQTLTSISVINEVVNIPVIRPLACFDKSDIIEIAKQINTYETSIIPYDDCCTVFVPKHPVINPKLDKAIEYENKIDYESLINKCLENYETITNFENDFKELL